MKENSLMPCRFCCQVSRGKAAAAGIPFSLGRNRGAEGSACVYLPKNRSRLSIFEVMLHRSISTLSLIHI